MVWVDDSGGSRFRQPRPARSIFRCRKSAVAKSCPDPCVESAGANLLQYQTELWSVFGGVFRNLAQMSAMGLPTMVVLHGGSNAGGAYMPGADYVIGVKENGMAALGGAALVKAATGEAPMTASSVAPRCTPASQAVLVSRGG